MRTQIVSVKKLKEADIRVMFDLFSQYYAKVSEEVFRKDLFEKQKVILLLGPKSQIHGFSTILQVRRRTLDEEFIALYSGDTVLHREHWGNGALAMAFGRYLMDTKLRNPFTQVYWFLISKGYKTYLLMTNNFPEHYPRVGHETPPAFAAAMDVFYRERFGNNYDSANGVIRFDSSKASHLKDYVAEITDESRLNPNIAFFERKNPEWKNGVELACVAKVSVWVPIRYVLKRMRKAFLTHGKGLKAIYRKQH